MSARGDSSPSGTQRAQPLRPELAALLDVSRCPSQAGVLAVVRAGGWPGTLLYFRAVRGRVTPACKDCGAGGLTWPTAGERQRDVSVSDRDSPLITVRSGTSRARSASASASPVASRPGPQGLRPEDRKRRGSSSSRTVRHLIRRYLSDVQRCPDRPASWHDRHSLVRIRPPSARSCSPGWLPCWLPGAACARRS